MAGMTDSHVWMVPVSPEVAALSTADASALVVGSTFARRIRETDPEHGKRLCDHGRLLFQVCGFCVAGIEAICDPTFEQMRENAKACLV